MPLSGDRFQETFSGLEKFFLGSERFPSSGGSKMDQERLEITAAASAEGWLVFVKTGIQSDFFMECREHFDDRLAARVTMLHLYLNTFNDVERERMLADVDFFLRFADGFVSELLPHGRYDLPSIACYRRVFQKAMRSMLGNLDGSVRSVLERNERRAFLRGSLDLASSIDRIIETWDVYKEYMHKHHPVQGILLAT